jgi:hypothetical protein
MSDILDFALNGHGGLDRWKEFASVSAHLSQGGVLWDLKQQGGVLAEVGVTADLGEEQVSHGPFGDPPVRTRFSPDMVTIESAEGQVLEGLPQPRKSFAGHVQTTPWNRLQLAYFAGAAMWTYITQPFSFTMPGFVTSEGDSWVEDGKSYRRMIVTWPSYLATHNPDQVLYLDEAGLIFRHDYTVEITGNTDAAHYMTEYIEVSGLLVPTRHRIYPRGADGQADPSLLIVSIDYSDVRYTPARSH